MRIMRNPRNALKLCLRNQHKWATLVNTYIAFSLDKIKNISCLDAALLYW